MIITVLNVVYITFSTYYNNSARVIHILKYIFFSKIIAIIVLQNKLLLLRNIF